MVRKFGLGDVFTIVEQEEHELSYHSNAIDESYNSEAVVTIELLNIAWTFSIELPTIHECPPSPILHYYAEMPDSLGTITNNHMKKIS
jgi:hypothetical protein